MGIEAIRSAARELCMFIGKANAEINKAVSGSDLQPSDYYNYQACHDLNFLADSLGKLQATHAKAIEAAYRDGYVGGILHEREYGHSVGVDWTSSSTYLSLHKGDKNGD